MFPPSKYLDLSHTSHPKLFSEDEPAWAAIGRIEDYLDKLLKLVDGTLTHGSIHPSANVGTRVYVAADAIVEANAVIQGPAWIGSGSVVRSGAYLRNNVIIGNHCVLGNSSEFKNCLLFDDCEVPHFNYVGDSILGYKAHLGAGVICSNVRLDRTSVKLRHDEKEIDSGLRKFGAIIGDRTEVGCNTVLNPGTILGRDCILYPVTQWQGILGEKKIVKNHPHLNIVDRK
ncbi:UDP-N-acetylglucosamine diphosphorylase [bacterium]|jgi:NDP-sugar pyrophosphorylase family protein|nr:UDP-N-acetylglucosamine diphosphorylase [Verrucomicrobiales bacterium]MDB2496462.1 UDP-N-acetylglucosamine diphosphorylase [Verrucomicrobiales bacterium]MDB3941204.1 UDP-N-acetylglucosamine diphosphorylase [Verrucomicrobiales bacterium]MDC0252394.1 UDP-N-acetylglucosamine diphosphorylase [bacterium]MDC3352542.1 UDP-N-acetylglucosamine diphosphorylase [Verrucomicrobiales bacterium]